VKLVGRILWVSIAPRSEPVLITTAVQSWYREHAGAVLVRRREVRYERAKRYDIPLPTLRIRKMKTRWGSCGKNDTIIPNPELIRLPTPCIDYVITLELCHLKVRNHNRDFYALLSKCMPDWIYRRERLNLAAV